ncbi:MAG: AbrB/MazE/SpoVT family DNA-binding domain-containing protein [Verrucomicrobiales bacterium]|nr:AbrB/MazE/SpoVT family DNA-binding domain-containing protein [Verrucomicrobiales bacterium]
MRTSELSIVRIGNSRGVRLPAEVLRRYQIGESVILEERPDEIVLRPKRVGRLSWEETAAQMAAENEDWSAWEGAVSDGTDEL